MSPPDLTRQPPESRFPPSTHVMTRPDGSRLPYGCWQSSAAASQDAGHPGSRGGRSERDAAAGGNARHGRYRRVFPLRTRRRDPAAGPADARRLNATVQDLDGWVRHLAQTHDKRVEDILVLASGLDALLLAVWVHDYAPRIRAMVLAAPRFRLPLALRERARNRCWLPASSERCTATRPAESWPMPRRSACQRCLLEAGRDAGVGTFAAADVLRAAAGSAETPEGFAPGGARSDVGRRPRIGAGRGATVRQRHGSPRHGPAPPAAGRPVRLHARRVRAAADAAARGGRLRGSRYRLLKAGIRALALVSPGIRFGVTNGIRLGADARLCVREPSPRLASLSVDRSDLSRQHRLEGLPPAKRTHREDAARGDRQGDRRRPTGPHCRHCRRSRSDTSSKSSAPCPASTSRPSCATTPRSTSKTDANWPNGLRLDQRDFPAGRRLR